MRFHASLINLSPANNKSLISSKSFFNAFLISFIGLDYSYFYFNGVIFSVELLFLISFD